MVDCSNFTELQENWFGMSPIKWRRFVSTWMCFVWPYPSTVLTSTICQFVVSPPSITLTVHWTEFEHRMSPFTIWLFRKQGLCYNAGLWLLLLMRLWLITNDFMAFVTNHNHKITAWDVLSIHDVEHALDDPHWKLWIGWVIAFHINVTMSLSRKCLTLNKPRQQMTSQK